MYAFLESSSKAFLWDSKLESVSRSVVPESLWPHGLQPSRLLCPWDFPGKDTGVGCHFFLQGIFPIQGSEPGSPALQADSLPTELQGKPKLKRSGKLRNLWIQWMAKKISKGTFSHATGGSTFKHPWRLLPQAGFTLRGNGKGISVLSLGVPRLGQQSMWTESWHSSGDHGPTLRGVT